MEGDLRIALLCAGTELLTGHTLNTNASEVGKMLILEGFRLNHSATVHDEAEEICICLGNLLKDHDAVILTGGIGPTTDDVTKGALLKFFGGKLVTDHRTFAKIESWFRRSGRGMNPAMEEQAKVPDSCTVLPNDFGTAPGMMFRKDSKFVFALPGVPQEMRILVKNHVIPILQKNFMPVFVKSRVLRVFGIPESSVEMKLKDLRLQIEPGIRFSFLPGDGEIRIEMKADASTSESASPDEAHSLVRQALDQYVFSEYDESLEFVLGRVLREKKLTVATAESCTGGAIAAKIVSVSGASEYFKGGIVAYQDDMKMSSLGIRSELIAKHTVVSPEIAVAMAKSVRLKSGANLGISITGYMENVSGESEEAVAQAWFAWDFRGRIFTEHYRFHQDRGSNIRRAVNIALFVAGRIAMKPESQIVENA